MGSTCKSWMPFDRKVVFGLCKRTAEHQLLSGLEFGAKNFFWLGVLFRRCRNQLIHVIAAVKWLPDSYCPSSQPFAALPLVQLKTAECSCRIIQSQDTSPVNCLINPFADIGNKVVDLFQSC